MFSVTDNRKYLKMAVISFLSSNREKSKTREYLLPRRECVKGCSVDGHTTQARRRRQQHKFTIIYLPASKGPLGGYSSLFVLTHEPVRPRSLC